MQFFLLIDISKIECMKVKLKVTLADIAEGWEKMKVLNSKNLLELESIFLLLKFSSYK